MTEFEGSLGREHLSPAPLIRDLVADLTFKEGRALPEEIDSLDLGAFSEDARTLANQCFIDPESNYAKLVAVTGTRRVFVPNATFKGSAYGIFVLGTTPGTERKTIGDKRLELKTPSMLIHTQGNSDTPLSVTGVSMLMREDSYPLALSALLMVGKTQNMAVFRGENTPQWTEEEAQKKTKLWVWQLNERLSQHVKPEMNIEQVNDINQRAQAALMRQICEKYSLKFFAGPTEGTVLTKSGLS